MIVDRNIGPLLVRETASLREALQRLNQTPHIMQLVVNGEGALAGTVTDGDIRRALVAGYDLSTPIEKAMRRDPILAHTVDEAIRKITGIGGRSRFVPVVDERQRPTLVVSDAGRTAGFGTALIMAGGYGRRLGERTKDMPKPLIPVDGQPILQHIIEDLVSHGVGRIIVATHYLSEKIDAFLQTMHVNAETIVEDRPLGTAGALSRLPADVNGSLMVLNGDIVTRIDYGAMALHHSVSQRDATVAAARHEIEIPFGVIDHDENGRVIAVREKPRVSSFVLAGIYVLEPAIYRGLPDKIPLDMPDLLSHALGHGRQVGVFPIHEYWLDMGRPDDLELVERTFQKRQRPSSS